MKPEVGGGAMLEASRLRTQAPEKTNQGTPWQDHSRARPKKRGEGNILMVLLLLVLLLR